MNSIYLERNSNATSHTRPSNDVYSFCILDTNPFVREIFFFVLYPTLLFHLFHISLFHFTHGLQWNILHGICEIHQWGYVM